MAAACRGWWCRGNRGSAVTDTDDLLARAVKMLSNAEEGNYSMPNGAYHIMQDLAVALRAARDRETIASAVNAGMSTCPICERAWLVTPLDDCLVPSCGHYGDDPGASNPDRPCHSCGLSHALECVDCLRGVAASPTPTEGP